MSLDRSTTYEKRLSLIISGIILLLATIGIIAYRDLSNIVDSIADEARPNQDNLYIKQIQKNFNKAENHLKAYSLTSEDQELRAFFNLANSCKSINKKLKSEARDDTQNLFADSIQSITLHKFAVFDKILSNQESYKGFAVLERIERSLEDTKSKVIESNLKQQGKLLQGILKRRETQKNGILAEGQPLDEFQEEVDNIQKEAARIEEKYITTELRLWEESESLTNQLAEIINKLDQEELTRIENKTKVADERAQKVKLLIAGFCGVSCILLIVVAFTLINYIKHNKEYRNVFKQARIDAENLAKSKEQFLANMSHEIRTPLHAISGFSNQLIKRTRSKDEKKQLQIIQNSATHLIRVVNDILDHSKLEADKLILEKKHFDLRVVMQEVTDLMNKLAEEKPVEIIISVAENIPNQLIGDEMRLKQVLINLIGNAIKFTDSGTISITARVQSTNPKEVEVAFSIEDTGIGIPSDKLKILFQEFEQALPKTAKAYGGTGLGLSISKKLIDLQKGTIRLESELEKGTSVHFNITYGLDHEKKSIITPKDSFTLEKTPESILIVDDNAYNRLLLSSILQEHHLSIFEAENGQTALKKCSLTKFDVIFMDIRMPIMDGVTATKSIRQDKNCINQNTVIIALTAATSEEDKALYKEIGMNWVLNKPFSEDTLLSALNIDIPQNDTSSIVQTGLNNMVANITPLTTISHGDIKFVEDMIEEFNKDLTVGLPELKEFYHSENWEALADLSHKLASPCRHLEANQLHQSLKEIEKSSRSNQNKAVIEEAIISLESAIEKTIDSLTEQLADYSKRIS